MNCTFFMCWIPDPSTIMNNQESKQITSCANMTGKWTELSLESLSLQGLFNDFIKMSFLMSSLEILIWDVGGTVGAEACLC